MALQGKGRVHQPGPIVRGTGAPAIADQNQNAIVGTRIMKQAEMKQCSAMACEQCPCALCYVLCAHVSTTGRHDVVAHVRAVL